MDDNTKISVILPVYNVAPFIGHCIDSLRAQTMQELEFIFVDDCSTDGSMEAVEAWADEDDRVRIIRNGENLGAGPSRNRGIEAARGDYLSFVDPDDYLAPDFYELLYAAATADGGHDIAKGIRRKINEADGLIESPEKQLNDRIRYRKNAPLYSVFAYEHQTAIYHHTLFSDGSARYGASRKAQDTTFLLRCCYQTEDIVLEESALYFYVQRKDSAVHRKGLRQTYGEIDSLYEMVDFLEKKGIDDTARRFLLIKLQARLENFQKLLEESSVEEEDYILAAHRFSSLLSRIPDCEAAIESCPQLKELISKCLNTAPSHRIPSEDKIRVSVILPVYNPGPGIHKCIESLRSQLMGGLEFIFVDDCSTDESMAAIEAWVAEDDRVRILRNDENLGAGPSRNRGIEFAQGDYLSFVDPDDYVSNDFYSLLYAAATKDGGHDIAKGLRVEVDAHMNTNPGHGEQMNGLITGANERSFFRRFSGDHWTAIYKRTLFSDGTVRYGVSRKSEDTTFTLRVCCRTEDIVIEPHAKYYYHIQREQSSIAHKDPQRFNYELDGLEEKIGVFKSKGLDEQAYEYLATKLSFYVNQYRQAARFGSALHREYKAYLDRISSLIEPLPGKRQILSSAPLVAKCLEHLHLTTPDLRFSAEGVVRVSVILPVYNPGAGIRECTESLRSQLMGGLEFIFVDDCSTDDSLAAIEAWAAEDERVRILCNDCNMGPGPSRNRGIEAACGEYLSFVDPDDYVSPDFYELLYAAATAGGGHDIAKGCYRKVDGSTGAVGPRETKQNERIKQRDAKGMQLFQAFTYEHQTAIYRAALFEDDAVRYGTSRKDQDTTFQLAYCLKAEDIVFGEDAIYYYVQRGGSIVHTASAQRFFDELDSLEEKAAILSARGMDDAAGDYLAVKLRVYLGNYLQAMQDNPALQPFAGEYCERIDSILSPLPNAERIRSLVPDLNELADARQSKGPEMQPYVKGEIAVSVVIPVYNVGSFIGRCIESLKAQTLTDLEFIFVDDCSTDDSMNAVEAWATEDDRVHILRNKENMGAGPSRNRGIEAARGDYLSFVDPDDYVSPDFYELLYAAATEGGRHDIAKGRVHIVSESYDEIEAPSSKLDERIASKLAKGIPLWAAFTGDHFCAIYHKDLFLSGDARYGTSKHCQDITFLLTACYNTNDIVLENRALYAYVQRSTSAIHTKTPLRFESDLDALEESIDFLMSEGDLGDTEYEYLAPKCAYRYKSYRSEMGKSQELIEHYPAFEARVKGIVNRLPEPERMMLADRTLKRLFDNQAITTPGLRSPGESDVRVSAILPVYNPGPGIQKCIESLRAQILDGLEFIFVDDCSTDGSMEAVEDWAAEDGRVRIIRNEENLGAGPSRNRGIEAARGDYLSFVDPDDYVSPNFYELLYAAAIADGGRDIAKGTRCTVDETGNIITNGGHHLDDSIRASLSKGNPLYCSFTYEHQSAIYRRTIFENDGVKYGTSRNSQDTTFLLTYCFHTNDIVFEEDAVYSYVHRLDSASNNCGIQRSYGDLDSLEEKLDFLLPKGIDRHAERYITQIALLYLKRFQELLGKGKAGVKDYALFADRLSDLIGRSPEAEEAAKINPRLNELLSGRTLTTPGLRSPGEGEVRVSVVLPVYNPGTGINKCIESLRQQLLDGLEFIFVDDRSTDGSMNAVEAWAAKDDRVRIIRNEKNLGAGPTRNRGIEAARGDYLSFVDPDDYVSPDFYELLYAAATADGGHDIAKGLCLKVDEVGITIDSGKSRLNKRIIQMLGEGQPLYTAFTYEHWSAIYHKRLFVDPEARYGLSRNGQDVTFLLRCTRQTDDIVIEQNALYHYVQRPGSAVNKDGGERTSKELDMFSEMLDYLSNREMDDTAKRYLLMQAENVLSRFQDVLGKGRAQRDDYAPCAQRLAGLLGGIPDIEQLLDNYPKVKEVVRGASFTTPGLRSPGEGDVRVSVILPVYNPGKGIDRCIESLRAQLLDGLEFIFVDDCSTDAAMAAVEAWAAEDGRVRIIRNEENLGAGPSRNRGIAAARGDYLSFVDPDDYVLPDFYLLLYAAVIAEGGHDIAKSSRYMVDSISGTTSADNQLNRRIRDHLAEGRPLYTAFTYEHQAALYRHKLFSASENWYGSSRCAEDTTFLLRYCHCTQDLVFEESAVYYYVQREGSLTHGDGIDRTHGEIDALSEKIDFLEERGLDSIACSHALMLTQNCLQRFQELLGAGLVDRNDYSPVAERLTSQLMRIPHVEAIVEKRPQLKELLLNRPLTTPDLRSPGEGDIRISVILPVYNPGEGIEKCIESLRMQLLDGLEFIFVDDCSTDGSMAAVEAWAAGDSRVRILRNEKNLGSGPTRNRGIEAARGDYLSFIDPDDYISPDFYELLYAAAIAEGGHDIAKVQCFEVVDNSVDEAPSSLMRKIRLYLADGIPLYRAFNYEHIAAIYKRSLFDNNEVRFGNTRNAQDTTFLLRCCYQTEDIVLVDSAAYYYVKRPGSATNSNGPRRTEVELDAVAEKIDFLESKGIDEHARRYIAAQGQTTLSRFQDLLGQGRVSREDYAHVAARLEALMRRAPGVVEACKDYPQLTELLSGRPLTTPGLRSPGEGEVRVSVVLPVYNPGKGIGRCIESLRAQLLDGLEFIFVDDRSTDESMAAVEAWAAEDGRVRIIRNEENLGAGPSRNRGIEAARGDYLSFVDPDDYVSPDFYELLYAAATKGGSSHSISKGTRQLVSESGRPLASQERDLNRIIESGLAKGKPLFLLFYNDHQCALFARRLFDSGVRYGATLVGEDNRFLLEACAHTNDVVLESAAIYHYVQRAGSIMSAPAERKADEGLRALEESVTWLLGQGMVDENAHDYVGGKLATRCHSFLDAAAQGKLRAGKLPELRARVAAIARSMPDPELVVKGWPALKNVMRNDSLVTPGLRSPGEGEVRVSVVLPVYNPGRGVDRCIKSLQFQLLDGLEFIFVDDCSTDGSMKAVEAWAAEDSRVHVIRNEQNMGAGPSRNRGIEAARGDYLSFVDPDDYVSPDFYELLYAAAIADGGHVIAKGLRGIVQANGKIAFTPSRKVSKRIRQAQQSGDPLYTAFTNEHTTAIYKRSLFDAGARYGTSRNDQDTTFLLAACLHANDIAFEEGAYYYYVKRHGSAVERTSIDRFLGELDALTEKAAILESLADDQQAQSYLRTKADIRLANYYSATKRDSALEGFERTYTERFASVIQTVPALHFLPDDNPAYQALIKFGAVLPAIDHLSSDLKVLGALDWVDFVATTQDNGDVYINGCADAAATAIQQLGKEQGAYGFKSAYAQIMGRIVCLPTRQSALLHAKITKRLASKRNLKYALGKVKGKVNEKTKGKLKGRVSR